ncbi:MAG: DUF2279 domain-containing protein [Dyadobacter sp. 50-39]|nr:MAG: DUF2279 domain-containing protein [Dyadobacter sp. 50-39]
MVITHFQIHKLPLLMSIFFLISWQKRLKAQPNKRQEDSITVDKASIQRLRWVLAGQGLVYGASTYGLSKSWYKNPLTNFRFRDDTSEWLQIDKVGHLYSSYQIARHSEAIYISTGIPRKRAILYSALSGIMFLTPIEILDGFSPEYGFSPGDMIANVLGSSIYAIQMSLWNELRVNPKFSFHYTSLAGLRPELLGSSLSDRWLKDYNGQTYWLSASPASFFAGSKWPAWLCVSLGYGIGNTISANIIQSTQMGYLPHREYYLSLDIDFGKIKSKKKWVRVASFLANSVKIPAPTLFLCKKSFGARALYF